MGKLAAAGKLVLRPLGQTAEDTDSVREADKIDMAIISARRRGDKAGLILALEVKVTELVS